MATEEKREVVIDDGRIEAIEEFQSPETLYQELIARVQKYHPSDDISLIAPDVEIGEGIKVAQNSMVTENIAK